MTISFCFSRRRVCADQEDGAFEVTPPLFKKVGMGKLIIKVCPSKVCPSLGYI